MNTNQSQFTVKHTHTYAHIYLQTIEWIEKSVNFLKIKANKQKQCLRILPQRGMSWKSNEQQYG